MRKFLQVFLIVVLIMVVVFTLTVVGGIASVIMPHEARVRGSSVLVLELEDIILDGHKFLEKLRRYRKDDSIKAVVIQINSPGGVVGPSQEIWAEIKRTREEFKKPVVASCLGLAASGAFYAAVGADKFVVTPGCMMGSIGVIMQFANMERLLEWAKIQRYALKTGAYKDTGAEYRPMKKEEKAMLQELLESVLAQFKAAIAEGRKLAPEVVDRYADGRIFTGEMGVKAGFADQVGTLDDAIRLAGELGGLGADPEVFRPKAHRAEEFFEMFFQEPEGRMGVRLAKEFLHLQLQGKPLMIWEGALGL